MFPAVDAIQNELIFKRSRRDFKSWIESILPQVLFATSTPAPIRERLQREFLKTDPELALKVIEPLYAMDVHASAKRVAVPVRAINSDFTRTHRDNNRKYFRDYDCASISAAGHYPMLERPDEFNRILDQILGALL